MIKKNTYFYIAKLTSILTGKDKLQICMYLMSHTQILKFIRANTGKTIVK